jgi:ketosteroid isomerase-like protein
MCDTVDRFRAEELSMIQAGSLAPRLLTENSFALDRRSIPHNRAAESHGVDFCVAPPPLLSSKRGVDMRYVIAAAVALVLLLAMPALADDHALLTQFEQQMANAVAAGDAGVWDRYLDPQVIYVEEDGSYKGKAAMLKEILPLPKGLSGEIKVELLSYRQDGDTAVALFRQNETEHYFGQTIHASYLTNTVWKKRPDGWKQIAAQVLAERTDPPAMTVPAERFAQYAGTYRLKDSSPVYILTVSNGELSGARNGRKPAVWKMEAPDVFFIPGDPRIRKIFQRDAQGNITGFVERRESWDIVWLKTR